MDIRKFIDGWLAAANAYDTTQYLACYNETAVLADSSVGCEFEGQHGIAQYFANYFIGYQTQTRLLKLETDSNSAKLQVEFTGTFPEGKIGGRFELEFCNGKIEKAFADLM